MIPTTISTPGAAVTGNRRLARTAAAAACVLLALGALAAAPAPGPPGDDELVLLAREKGRVLIADFGLGMCLQCKRQTAILEEVRKAYGDKVLVRMVHVNREHDLTARYGIEQIPHLIFFDPSGCPVLRKTGVMGFTEIAAQLARMGVTP